MYLEVCVGVGHRWAKEDRENYIQEEETDDIVLTYISVDPN
jgi:hypothetical protein